MRGAERKQATMLSLLAPEHRVPQKHPLRAVKALADAALTELSRVFDEMYSAVGRPSIPPERLLKASLLMALYTVRSERLFCEQLDYNLLFRWFLDMNMDEKSFDPTVFTKNRERRLKHNLANKFFCAIHRRARRGERDDGPLPAGNRGHHAGRRQGLRHARLHREVQSAQRHTARRAECRASASLSDRRPDDAACWLCN